MSVLPESGPAPASRISAIVIARDAAATIERCVTSLAFADEVLVVDGGSRDETIAIAQRLGARVIPNPWPGFPEQRRFALAAARYPWAFACDADEVVTEDLAREIGEAVRADAAAGFRVRRRNQFLGSWMDVGPWARDQQLRLLRRDLTRVTDAAVHEGYLVDGPVSDLHSPLLHQTHATLSESVERLNRYTTLEAGARASRRRIGVLDALVLPAGVFINYYVLKGCWRAGVRGYLLAVITAMYKSVLYIKTRERQQRESAGGEGARG